MHLHRVLERRIRKDVLRRGSVEARSVRLRRWKMLVGKVGDRGSRGHLEVQGLWRRRSSLLCLPLSLPIPIDSPTNRHCTRPTLFSRHPTRYLLLC